MAYRDGQTTNSRTFAVIAGTALHGAVLYALITGLAADYIRDVMPVITARNIPVEPVLPSPSPPVEQKIATRDAVRKPVPEAPVASPLNRGVTIDIPYDSIAPTADPVPTGTLERVAPPPPAFVPHRAIPRGEPGRWATPADYPTRDLREGNQGVTRFRLTVGADGRVTACSVVQSSGFSGLDEATCRNVSRRARFKPATDEHGQPMAGEYSSSIRWEIPEG